MGKLADYYFDIWMILVAHRNYYLLRVIPQTLPTTNVLDFQGLKYSAFNG